MIEIYISDKLKIVGAPHNVKVCIIKALTIPNPLYKSNEKYGRWNGDTPEDLKLYRTGNNCIYSPRGFLSHIYHILEKNEIRWKIIDNRFVVSVTTFNNNIILKPYQEKAVKDLLDADFSVLNAPTGSGKTVMACHMIAKRQQPTLVIVHTKELLKQWLSRIETFLDIPKKEIGVIGAGKNTIGKKVTVGLVQTLKRRKLAGHFGHVIIDECHRIPSKTFTEVVANLSSKYQLGLSATPYRRDGLSKLIFYYVGDIVHKISENSLVETNQILKPEIIPRYTDFRFYYKFDSDYQPMISALTKNIDRNNLIVSDIIKEVGNEEPCIILSDRKSHCNKLAELLFDRGVSCAVLTGDVPETKRQEIVDKLNTGEIRVIIATGQLLGEGFDCKELSCIFLTVPIKYKGRLKQYIGRVLRTNEGKKEAKVYDYVDSKIGVLYASYKSRLSLYNE